MLVGKNWTTAQDACEPNNTKNINIKIYKIMQRAPVKGNMAQARQELSTIRYIFLYIYL